MHYYLIVKSFKMSGYADLTIDNFDKKDITSTLLEKDPELYLEYLKLCIDNKIDIESEINSKVYETWYSNHLMCLGYLVGDLKDSEQSMNYTFYGSNSSISENLGIEILNALVKLGVDLYSKSYYDINIFQHLITDGMLTNRINNDRFKQSVFNLKRSPSP